MTSDTGISRRGLLGGTAAATAGLLLDPAPAGSQTAGPQPACGGKSTLDLVRERSKVVIGIRNDAPPFGFIDRSGKNAGFGVDVGQEIANLIKVQADLRPVTVTTRIPLVQTGGVDMVIDSALITRERWNIVDFSLTYYLDFTGNRLITKKNVNIANYDDLATKRVGVVQGSLGINRIQKNAPTAELVYFQDYPSAVLAVKRDRVDAMYAMDTIVNESLKNDRDGDLKASPPLKAEQNYGIILRQNDAKWRNQVNFCLSDMWQNGSYAALFRKNFGRDPDPSFSLPAWEG